MLLEELFGAAATFQRRAISLIKVRKVRQRAAFNGHQNATAYWQGKVVFRLLKAAYSGLSKGMALPA
jgi:hypothetical protein